MIVVLGAIQPGHEEHRAAQDGRRAHRARGQVRTLAQQVHRVDRLIPQGAIAQHADERPAIETFGNLKHGVDPAEGDDVGYEVRVEGREGGVDLARIFFIHGHGDLEAAPSPAETVDHLEAAHVGTHEQGAAAALRLLTHHVLAIDRDVEKLELPVDQIDAIVNGGREAQDLPKAVAHAWVAAEREAQKAPRMPTRGRCEQKEIDRDPVQRNAAQGAA